MKGVLQNLTLVCALIFATTVFFFVADARSQPLTVYHPQIVFPITSILPVRPSPKLAPSLPNEFKAPQVARTGVTGCAVSPSQPAPIIAIVSALKCDPDLIFEYVYNNIEFEALYGSNKGSLGTLLDRRGDDADQAMLLVTLWNAAGYSQTGYANIYQLASGTAVANWLGVRNDAIAIEGLLDAGGIPWGSPSVNPDGTLGSIAFLHFQAALNLGGIWYFFDPSFKQHAQVSGVSSIASAIGYNRAQFLSDIGGTIDGMSISNLNRTRLRADLNNYAANLTNYVNQNNRTWSVGNVIGGKTIQPLLGSPIRQQLSGTTPSSTFFANCPNQTPAPECRTYITITMPGASSGQAIKLYTDQVYGHRITVFSIPSGGSYVPTLLIDGAAPSCVSAGTCTNVGSATAPGQPPWQIMVQVTEPNQAFSASCATGVTECTTLTVAVGGSYLISTGVGQVGRGMAEYHRQLLVTGISAPPRARPDFPRY